MLLVQVAVSPCVPGARLAPRLAEVYRLPLSLDGAITGSGWYVCTESDHTSLATTPPVAAEDRADGATAAHHLTGYPSSAMRLLLLALLSATLLSTAGHAAPGLSQSFWEYGRRVGSRYYWLYGQGTGSEYYWVYGKRPGSEYYWKYGKESGSEWYWNNGEGPGSRRHWEDGTGPLSRHYWLHGSKEGSEHYWRYGRGPSTDAVTTVLCASAALRIELCAPFDVGDTPPLPR